MIRVQAGVLQQQKTLESQRHIKVADTKSTQFQQGVKYNYYVKKTLVTRLVQKLNPSPSLNHKNLVSVMLMTITKLTSKPQLCYLFTVEIWPLSPCVSHLAPQFP